MRQRLRTKIDLVRRSRQSPERVFSDIYASGAWEGHGDGFYSGSGSDDELAEPYVDVISTELRGATEDEIVVDLGCGDFRVGRLLLRYLPTQYVGVDVVPKLVAHNQERFANDRVTFAHADITRDEIPDGDYCLVRQVFQHLSNAQVLGVLPKLRKFRRIFVTEGYPADETTVIPNLDKVHGSDVRAPASGLYFDQPPFNLSVRELLALRWLPRGSTATTPRYVIKTFELTGPLTVR